MSQPTNCYVTSRRSPSRHQITTIKANKLELCSRIINSVILVMIIQTTQLKCLESARHMRGEQQQQMEQRAQSLFELDPIVFNTKSLYNSHERHKRATAPPSNQKFVDACQSKMEVLTPYYATNSKGKLRTIVNSELMQQAIQIESCVSLAQSTRNSQVGASNRCNVQPECGCEQKYKWHRLLASDPTDEASASKGLFMDWFLFPSSCVCRCKSGPNTTRQFLRTMIGNKKPHQPE